MRLTQVNIRRLTALIRPRRFQAAIEATVIGLSLGLSVINDFWVD